MLCQSQLRLGVVLVTADRLLVFHIIKESISNSRLPISYTHPKYHLSKHEGFPYNLAFHLGSICKYSLA